jgi:FkbM family methyltransferase
VWRATLEKASHRLVIRRRLPSPFRAARIYASTEGGLRYLRPRMNDVDPCLLRLVQEEVGPGSVVWDIGANVGLFTFAAAVAAGPNGHVLAIEPDTLLVGMLRRSAAANRGQATVDVLATAVADEVGVARFNVARRNRATSHLDGFGTAEAGGVRATQIVPTVTLDWLATRFPLPSLLKIDVEEAELKVFAGGSTVLRSHPTIICEVAGQNSVAVQEILSGYGYTLFDGDEPPSRRVPAEAAPFSTLAVCT